MREAHYLHEGNLLADGSGLGLNPGEHSGELFLVFSIRLLGLCALPIAAVQTVCAADGPVRPVPLCGGAGSRFAGLVSVRGQVQLLFDLSAPPASSGMALPPPASAEHLLVAVATDGRTLALRVSPPLRLVRRELATDTDATAKTACADAAAVPVCGSFTMPEADGETVWLLAADPLFARLEAEVRRG